MDILIKNMEMPSGCFEVLENGSAVLCFLYDKCRGNGIKPNKDERPKDCPLIPVPEHGDLIDRDKEINEWEQTKCILSECEQKHTFEYRKACVVINALSQAEVVLERTT